MGCIINHIIKTSKYLYFSDFVLPISTALVVYLNTQMSHMVKDARGDSNGKARIET